MSRKREEILVTKPQAEPIPPTAKCDKTPVTNLEVAEIDALKARLQELLANYTRKKDDPLAPELGSLLGRAREVVYAQAGSEPASPRVRDPQRKREIRKAWREKRNRPWYAWLDKLQYLPNGRCVAISADLANYLIEHRATG